MSPITISKSGSQRRDATQTSVALRLAAAIVPAVALCALWGDFARSVFVGDSLRPVIEAAARDVAGASAQQRRQIAEKLTAVLHERADLRDVSVDVVVNPDRSATVHVRVEVPNLYLPAVVDAYGVERSATAGPALPRA